MKKSFLTGAAAVLLLIALSFFTACSGTFTDPGAMGRGTGSSDGSDGSGGSDGNGGSGDSDDNSDSPGGYIDSET